MSPRKGVVISLLRTSPLLGPSHQPQYGTCGCLSPFESVFRGIGNAPPAVPCCIVLPASSALGRFPSKNVAPPVYPFCARSSSVLKGGIARVWICTGSGAHTNKQQLGPCLHDCPIAKASGLCLYLHGADNLMALTRSHLCLSAEALHTTWLLSVASVSKPLILGATEPIPCLA